MVSRNGVGTFAALKRELSSAARAGSIRSIGEVVALRQLLIEERMSFATMKITWEGRRLFINRHREKAGIEVDSLLEGHEDQAAMLIHQFWARWDDALGRDITKISAFLDERGVSY